ncbi:MAG: site-specific integrase [Dehalococcoidia bacterium]
MADNGHRPPQRPRRDRGTGSLTRLPNGRWMGRVTVAPGQRKTVYAPTKTECQAAMRRLLSAAEKGEPIPDGRTTVETFLREWLDGPARRGTRPATHRGYVKYVEKHLIPALGHHRLINLRPEHVEKMLDAMATRGLSPRTRAHARAVLRTALAWGERDGRVARNAARLSTPPHIERPEMRVLSASEARQLVEAAQHDQWGALYVLALDTGLRQGELLGLRWDDVDLDTRTLRVVQTRQAIPGPATFGEPKSRTSRRAITFSATTAALLKRHRTRQAEQRLASKTWQDTGLVFTRTDGRPLNGPSVSRRWRRFLESHALPGVRFHDLRHSSASLLLAGGLPARAVADRLGHSSTRLTTDTYAHLASLRDAAADHIDRVLGGPR